MNPDELFLAVTSSSKDAQRILIAQKEVIPVPVERYPVKPIVPDAQSYPFTEGGDNDLFLRHYYTDY